MDFYDLVTAFDSCNRRGAHFDRAQFVAKVKHQLKLRHYAPAQEAHELLRFQSEDTWAELGKPYFKLWPSTIPMLSDVSVDVPAQYLRLPYSVFLLRFPRGDSVLSVDEQFRVQTVLVTEISDSTHRIIYLWIDIGETEPTGLPMLHWYRLPCQSAQSIEKAFVLNRMPGLPGVSISDGLAQKLLRIAVATSFLATGMDRLIEPDILSKDLSAYIEARRRHNESRIKKIEQRAVRRKGPGWNVGRQERLRAIINPPTEEENGGAGRPLTYQHQRHAHFRLLSNGTVVFVRQATVRPDLPPPTTRPAYAVD